VHGVFWDGLCSSCSKHETIGRGLGYEYFEIGMGCFVWFGHRLCVVQSIWLSWERLGLDLAGHEVGLVGHRMDMGSAGGGHGVHRN
jgi:hypothetical protein